MRSWTENGVPKDEKAACSTAVEAAAETVCEHYCTASRTSHKHITYIQQQVCTWTMDARPQQVAHIIAQPAIGWTAKASRHGREHQ